jgi:hypothetical protein
LSRKKNGICDQIKKTLNFFNSIKVLRLEPTLINDNIDFELMNNSQLFKIYFAENSILVGDKNNFVKLYFEEFNKIINIENNNILNVSNLLNLFCYIKSFIYEYPNKLNYCSLSIQKISDDLSLAKNTIMKNISVLESINILYVYRSEDFNLANGKVKKFNNIYSITKYNFEDIKSDYFANNHL